MIRDMFKTLVAALLVGAISLPVFSAAAHAGGSVSVTYAPAGREDAGALAAGLRVYSLYRGWRSASIRQSGDGNAAAIDQTGRGVLGIIRQRGKGHSATLKQNGNDNAYGLFQFGRGTAANIEQNGQGSSGITFSYGW
ncbi:curlin [Sinorhizobium numidicum]|uniref:Curlin n=1 Tax=Sinorhizobium numidicum TaxID=680248 RepID=A0ABY8CPZ8_9HYPH|nr:curlin [Sinorhizobium numidicum]WEX74742.1 curlin [Sinorhizobium numidicum]WEX80733.1 curlin [Sinorhizobium numidicum]